MSNQTNKKNIGILKTVLGRPWASKRLFKTHACRPRGCQAPTDFGRSVNPILTPWGGGADYAPQMIMAPSNFQTFLRPCPESKGPPHYEGEVDFFSVKLQICDCRTLKIDKTFFNFIFGSNTKSSIEKTGVEGDSASKMVDQPATK